VRAELARPDAPDEVVGKATWDGRTVRIEASNPDEEQAIRRIFRSTPVVVDDASLRGPGATGPSVLEPGDLQWFIAAARTRAQKEGLTVRLVATDGDGMGWDPAVAYRSFREAVARRDLRTQTPT